VIGEEAGGAMTAGLKQKLHRDRRPDREDLDQVDDEGQHEQGPVKRRAHNGGAHDGGGTDEEEQTGA